MSSIGHASAPLLFDLPNGMRAFGLNENDTLTVYRDIFDDDCYRKNGIVIKDGDCVLDVGANTGLFILYLNKIGANVRVFAFEPAPAAFQALRRNAETCHNIQVEVFKAGMAHRSGKAELTYYPRFSNASTLFPDDSREGRARGRQYIMDLMPTLWWPVRIWWKLHPHFLQVVIAEIIRRYYLKKEVVSCELWNLSEFLKKHDIAQVDLLKVDAEQSEEEIFAGIADDDWPKIRQIVVEVHGGPAATQAMLESLSRRGFRASTDPNPSMPTLALVYAVRPVS
jgi:FkbM family methyltransferase